MNTYVYMHTHTYRQTDVHIHDNVRASEHTDMTHTTDILSLFLFISTTSRLVSPTDTPPYSLK